MKGIGLMRPLPIADFDAGGTGLENLYTAEPKEVWVAPSTANVSIDIDMGAAVELDSFFLGFTNAGDGALWTVQKGTGMGTGLATISGWRDVRMTDAEGPRYSGWQRLDDPVTGRYFRIILDQTGEDPFQVGIIAAGLTFDHAYSLGAGRTPIDMSSVTPLRSGGFGIDEGAIKAAFRWRFVDLGPAELKLLWKLAKSRGASRPLIVVEDLEVDPLDDESVHYCLFQQFEAYERAEIAETKWALAVQQWV